MTASHKTSAGVCALLLGICAVLGSACRTTTSGPGATLENPFLRLTFDADRGVLASIDNRLTSEHLAVEGDEFAVTTEEFHATPQSFRLRSLEKKSEESLVATYDADARTVQAVYQLGSKNHFLGAAFILTVREGKEAAYREAHQAVWPELIAAANRAGIRNHSCFMNGRTVVAYLEGDNIEKSSAQLANDPVKIRWNEYMEEFLEPGAIPLEEVFHME